MSLTVTGRLLTPPHLFKKKQKNNFPNNCFCGCNNSTSNSSEVLKYKRGQSENYKPFNAKQAMNILYCRTENKHVFFHLVLQFYTQVTALKSAGGKSHQNKTVFLKLRLNKIRRSCLRIHLSSLSGRLLKRDEFKLHSSMLPSHV